MSKLHHKVIQTGDDICLVVWWLVKLCVRFRWESAWKTLSKASVALSEYEWEWGTSSSISICVYGYGGGVLGVETSFAPTLLCFFSAARETSSKRNRNLSPRCFGESESESARHAADCATQSCLTTCIALYVDVYVFWISISICCSI